VTYSEYFLVPEDSGVGDLLTYVRMFTDYVNASNTTLINVTASPGRTLEFLEHRRAYFGEATASPPPSPPPREGNPEVERPFFFDEKGVRMEIPQLSRDTDLHEHFTTGNFAMRYITTPALAERYAFAGKERGDPEEMPVTYFARAQCAVQQAVLVKMDVRLLLQSEEARTDFFTRLYGVTVDAAFKRFDVRSCFTEQMVNHRLECDPAPSPPPPNDWVSQNITSNLTHAHAHTPILYDAHCLGKHPSSYTERLRTARQAHLLVQKNACNAILLLICCSESSCLPPIHHAHHSRA